MTSPVVTVPSMLIGQVGEVAGVQVVPWDLTEEPAQVDAVEVVVVPPMRAPWLKELDRLPALRAVQLCTAGFEHALPFVPAGASLSNAVGVHDTATAELALALMLAAQRGLPDFVLAQQEQRWLEQSHRRSLADSRVLVVGYGGIGRALTRRLLASEASVTAVASRARAGDDLVEQVHGSEELMRLLAHHDVVVLAVPDSPATRRLLDATALALLPDDALVVNVGRGTAVDADALAAECASGRLRAALDVTDPEPLPQGHPLWTTPGVLLSPHQGGLSRAFLPRAARFVRAQLEHYAAHRELEHVVAPAASAHQRRDSA